MTNNICFSKSYLVISITILLIIGFGAVFVRTKKPPIVVQKAQEIRYNRNNPPLPSETPSQILVQGNPTLPPPPPPSINPDAAVTRYDYLSMDDPLSGAYRRLPRHQLPVNYLNQVYTRGLPDNYTMIGTLTRLDVGSSTDRILPLYGRQTYPTSPQWEYYTSTTNLGVQLKVPFETNKQELMTDDIIKLKDFRNAEYRVSLYKLDSPVYNPFVLY